jgi:hypothetical protein
LRDETRGDLMTDAKTYREAAAELRREARVARDPTLRNRLWGYAIEYDERAAALAVHGTADGTAQPGAAFDRRTSL